MGQLFVLGRDRMSGAETGGVLQVLSLDYLNLLVILSGQEVWAGPDNNYIK